MSNKQKLIVSFLGAVVSFILVVLFILLTIEYDDEVYWRIYGSIALVGSLIILLVFSYFTISNFVYSKQLLKNFVNGYAEEIVAHNNLGIIIYDNRERILWASSFIKDKFISDCVGLTISDFFRRIAGDEKITNNHLTFQIQNDNGYFEVQIWPIKNSISIRDTTAEIVIKNETKDQQIVIGEVEIDNFQLFQSILSEEQLFNINKSVINTIESFSKFEEYNLIYRQYTNGKFIIITNQKTLDILKEKDFGEFVNIRDKSAFELNNKISVSIGFASGWSSLLTIIEQAKKALLQAQNRGGDQVAIFSNTDVPVYYGSTSQILANNNRSNIKLIAKNLENKFQDKNIKNVIIYGHAMADLDALGSAWALYELARKYGKETYIGNHTFDLTTKKVLENHGIKTYAEPFINPNKASKLTDANTLVILVDNSVVERTDNKEAIINVKSENIFIFDHHRVGPSVDYCPRNNRYIDPNASSASEIITELITFVNTYNEIDKLTAQFLLNGIYLDTGQFTKTVTPRAFSAASWLESKGASGALANESLKIDAKTAIVVQQILENIEEIKPGFFLAYKDMEVENDVISIAADEILRISGRHAGFVIAKLVNTNTYKLSARGINTNVQIICEAVGGGGHFGTAAATTQEDLETFVLNLKHAIASIKSKY